MNKNIILIGPKAVGKSSIASVLQDSLEKNGFGKYEILKLDLFFKYCNDAYNKNLFFSIHERKFMLSREIEQLKNECGGENSEDFNNLKLKLIADFENSEEEKFALNETFKFVDFNDIVKNYEEFASIQSQTHMICNDSFMTYDQTVFLKVLERCLQKYKKPLIIDAGANIGPVYDMSGQDITYVQYRFPDIDIKTYQDKIFDNIPYKVFIEPCEEYYTLPCDSIHNVANRMYLKNPDSYKKYANITVKPNKLYNLTFEHFDRNNTVEKIAKSLNLNQDEISKVVNEIISQMQQIKIYEPQ